MSMWTEYEKQEKSEKERFLNKVGWTAEQMMLISNLPVPKLKGKKAEFVRLYAAQGFTRQTHAYHTIYPASNYPAQEAWRMLHEDKNVRLLVDILKARQWSQANITLPAVAETLAEIMSDVTVSARDRVAAAAQLRAILMPKTQDPSDAEDDANITLTIGVSKASGNIRTESVTNESSDSDQSQIDA